MWRVFAALVIAGCSSREARAKADLHRDCVAPVVRSCSKLAVLTSHEPLPFSTHDSSGEPFFLRGDGFEVVRGGILQHYVIDGAPPRLRATSDAALDPEIRGVASDGEGLFACTAQDDLVAYDSVNMLQARVPGMIDPSATGCSVAAFQGIVMSERAGSDWVGVFYDARGRALFREPGIPALTTGSYGCGFFWWEFDTHSGPSLQFMPLDERPRTSASLPYHFSWRWPYDPRSVAVVESTGGHLLHLSLVRDDGQTVFSRTYSTAQYVDAPTLFAMSFGVVLYLGNFTFQIIDADGSLVGDPLAVVFAPPNQAGAIVQSKDFIAIKAVDAVDFYQTVIGCANP